MATQGIFVEFDPLLSPPGGEGAEFQFGSTPSAPGSMPRIGSGY